MVRWATQPIRPLRTCISKLAGRDLLMVPMKSTRCELRNGRLLRGVTTEVLAQRLAIFRSNPNLQFKERKRQLLLSVPD